VRRYNPVGHDVCPVCVTVDKSAPPEEVRRVALLQVGHARYCCCSPSQQTHFEPSLLHFIE
jgi:hypothetical protein